MYICFQINNKRLIKAELIDMHFPYNSENTR